MEWRQINWNKKISQHFFRKFKKFIRIQKRSIRIIIKIIIINNIMCKLIKFNQNITITQTNNQLLKLTQTINIHIIIKFSILSFKRLFHPINNSTKIIPKHNTNPPLPMKN